MSKGTQTDAVLMHNPFSYVATISEKNDSDFDLGSFRGSMLDHNERGRFQYSQRARRLNTIRTISNMANDDTHSQNPRDITFRPSELSDESINDSPEIPLVMNGRTREGRTTPNIRVNAPNEDNLVPSIDHSMEGVSPNGLLDSPTSNRRSKAKTVSFQLKEKSAIETPMSSKEQPIKESMDQDSNFSRESNSELDQASRSQQ